MHEARGHTNGKSVSVTERIISPGSATITKSETSMSPVLSDVPVVCPVSRGAVTPAGTLGAGETLTAASRADTLVRLVETPAQAPKQLDDALLVLCWTCEVRSESIILNLLTEIQWCAEGSRYFCNLKAGKQRKTILHKP